MTDRTHRFEYDVALLFAGKDREVAERLADACYARNMSVLLDDYDAIHQPGTDVLTHIGEIFRTKAWYCVILVSQHYPLKSWTDAERTSVQQHALRDAEEYTLLVRVDESELSGATSDMNLRDKSVENIVALVEEKLGDAQRRSGPPPQSHDLRSGNVPPANAT